MTKKTKKVILFIVEGPTEESALGPILKKLYQSENVRFHVVSGDLTSEHSTTSSNVVAKINERIKKEMDSYGYRSSDIMRVVHIIDTDGAFIPDNQIIQGAEDDIHYEDDCIIACDINRIQNRNQKKKAVLLRLYIHSSIGSIPYSVYYFSRNMEHVLHDRSGSLNGREKMNCADAFAQKYKDSTNDFLEFITKSSFAVQEGYLDSWKFIFRDTNSLHRFCNLHILFAEK